MKHNQPTQLRPVEDIVLEHFSRAELNSLMANIAREMNRRESRRAEKKLSYQRRLNTARREASLTA